MLVPLALVAADLRATAQPARGGRLAVPGERAACSISRCWRPSTPAVPPLVLSLATASALFHAIEYLSLVGWSVQRRHAAVGSRMGLLGYLVAAMGITLGAFMLILGAGGWLLDQHWLQAWLTVNVIVAFLHYAYDGLIWRHRPTVR